MEAIAHKVIIHPKRYLLGKRLEMSHLQNRTPDLWRSFSPVAASIEGRANANLISAEVYPQDYFTSFSPDRVFEKWAAVEVKTADSGMPDMELLVVPEGRYAVFVYRGSDSHAAGWFQTLFSQWLPMLGFTVDARPHLAVMGEKYQRNHPDSEEEIWVPIL